MHNNITCHHEVKYYAEVFKKNQVQSKDLKGYILPHLWYLALQFINNFKENTVKPHSWMIIYKTNVLKTYSTIETSESF